MEWADDDDDDDYHVVHHYGSAVCHDGECWRGGGYYGAGGANEKKELDLMTHYFPKFTEAIGAPRAAKFYQVERQLNRILRAKIASLIPLAKPK